MAKVRNGFVTNSSSSSFILGFKDEDSIAKTLADDDTYGYFEIIYHDCLEAEKMDIETMLNNCRESIYWEVFYDLKYDLEDKMDWNKVYEFIETEEYKNLVKEETDRRIEILRKDAESKSVFVNVEYEDHSVEGSDLEHDIVPYLDCCLKVFNNH